MTSKKPEPLTSVLHNGGFSSSYDSLVQGSSTVLRLNFCAINPPLRKAGNRYGPFLNDNANRYRQTNEFT